jgi:hypothetical protein
MVGWFVNERRSNYAKGGFALRTSPPHCPQAMGLSQGFNRILWEKKRAILKERKLERSLWEDAMRVIVFVQNRIINDDQQRTPFELINGFKPNLSNLRIFGVPTFVYNFDPLRRKLNDKAIEGLQLVTRFIQERFEKSWRVYRWSLMNQGKWEWCKRPRTGWGPIVWFRCGPRGGCDWLWWSRKFKSFISSPSGIDSRPSSTLTPNHLPLDVEPRLRARPRVNYKSLNRFGTVLNVSLVENLVELTTVKEALESDLSDLWEEAMEIESIHKHETWEVATPPRDAHPITTKWVFTIREIHMGNLWNAKPVWWWEDSSSWKGKFKEIFSPVVKAESIQTLLSLAAVEDLEVDQVDVKTAFLHGEVLEDISIYAPKGAGSEKGTILKLRKSLDGIRQAPRVDKRFIHGWCSWKKRKIPMVLWPR